MCCNTLLCTGEGLLSHSQGINLNITVFYQFFTKTHTVYTLQITVYKLYKGDLKQEIITDLDPVVQRPISANPGLNFSASFFFICSKAFPRAIFSQLFLEHSINKLYAKRMKLNVAFKLLYLNSNFTPNPGLSWPAFEQTGPDNDGIHCADVPLVLF